MKVRVKLFAMARELAGQEEVEVEVAAGATVGDLRGLMQSQFPALAPLLRRSLIAVDHNYAPDSTAIHADSELACIPPVSGG